MVAIGKAMALLDIDPDAMGRWICAPRPDGRVLIDDPITGRSWTVTQLRAPIVRAMGPVEVDEPPVVEAPVAAPAEPAAPPAPLVMPAASIAPPVQGVEPAEATPDAPPPSLASSPSGPPADLAERLFELSFDVAAGPPDEACRRTLDLVLEFVPCEAASVLRGTLNDTALTFVAAAGPVADELVGRKLDFGVGLAGLCFDLGFPIEILDVKHDSHHLGDIDAETGFSTRQTLCVPVRDDSGAFGVIQLINPPGGQFLDWHVDTVVTVARTLAGALAAD